MLWPVEETDSLKLKEAVSQDDVVAEQFGIDILQLFQFLFLHL